MARGRRPGRLRLRHRGRACARGATTRCCWRRRRRRPAAWCWSTASTPGCRRRTASTPSARSATRRTRSIRTARGTSSRSTADPWPRWRFRLADGTAVEQELFVPAGTPAVALAWRLVEPQPGVHAAAAAVPLRPRLSRPAPREPGLPPPARARRRAPGLAALSGRARHPVARQRRLHGRADLVPQLPLSRRSGARPRCGRGPRLAGHADLGPVGGRGRLGPGRRGGRAAFRSSPAAARSATVAAWRDSRARRRRHRRRACTAPPTPTSCSASAARRSSPAIRGSPIGAATRSSPCAASAWPAAGSTTRARSCWRGPTASPQGMLPNRFPDHGEAPEFNSVDASLWYVDRRARAARRRRRRRRCRTPRRTRCAPRSRRSSPATPPARATASAATPTACCAPASPACSSPGWTPRSATGW